MKTLLRLLGAFAIMSCTAPTSLEAQARIRVAIWDFENHSERSWWFYDDLGPAARNHIDAAFSENDVLSSRFSVIEREKLDLVLKEQGLATSGALDQQTAAKVGRVLGIKYIITGAIDKFAINTTKGGFGGIGGSGRLLCLFLVTAQRHFPKIISLRQPEPVRRESRFEIGVVPPAVPQRHPDAACLRERHLRTFGVGQAI